MLSEDDADMESKVVSKQVFALFKEYRSRPFVFVEPGGNFGDYLIWKGAVKLADLAGIRFRSVKYKDFTKSDYSNDHVIYIHGSGGFNPMWSGSPMLALQTSLSYHTSPVIVGPSTFWNDPMFLRDMSASLFEKRRPKKVFLFTREAVSNSALRPCLPGWVELCLDHDTALNLSPADFAPFRVEPRYSLYAIREDKESLAGFERDPFRPWLDPIKYCRDFDHWVALHCGAKRLFANRLHSAIAGSVLGVPTTLLPNSYHKNRSVWEYSLRHRGVQWADDLSPGILGRAVNAIPGVNTILASSRFQSVLMRHFYGLGYRNLVSRCSHTQREKAVAGRGRSGTGT